MPAFKYIRKSLRYKYVTLYDTPDGLRWHAKYYHHSGIFKNEKRAANFVINAIKKERKNKFNLIK